MMPDDEHQPPASASPPSIDGLDALLPSLLRALAAPEIPASLDRRVLAAFRQRTRSVGWWRRLTAASISVPLPIAALAGLLLLACLWLARGLETAGDAPQVASAPTLAVVTHTDLGGFVPVRAHNVIVIPARSTQR